MPGGRAGPARRTRRVARPHVRSGSLTVDDDERLTTDTDTDTRYELSDGDLIEMPAPTISHQWVLRAYFRLLDRFMEENGLGEVLFAPLEVELSPRTVLQPDLVVVATGNGVVLADDRRVIGGPALVVEIPSPSTGEVVPREADLYAGAGVRECRVVDRVARTHTTWVLDGDRDVPLRDDRGLARGRVFPGRAVDLAARLGRDG